MASLQTLSTLSQGAPPSLRNANSCASAGASGGRLALVRAPISHHQAVNPDPHAPVRRVRR
jgi:hypothetical protein